MHVNESEGLRWQEGDLRNVDGRRWRPEGRKQ